MRCLAIDIGGTKIASALVENNQISQRQQVATPTENVSTEMQKTLTAIINGYKNQFDFVAVASTGIINKGILTALNPKNLGGLDQFPLKNAIANHTDKPVLLLNDVQAAAYAEFQNESKNDIQNFAFITVSTGVGGGIILNKTLLTEPNGIAGHIGHSLADPNGEICGCGRQGCVEAVASGRAIQRATESWETPCLPKQVFELFRQQEPKATQIIHRSAKAIANLVADLMISLDMQKIVIGGSVGLAEGYLPLVKDYINQMPSIYSCEIEPAYYQGDAGLIGAAKWGENVLQNH